MPSVTNTVCRILYIDDTEEDLRMLAEAVSTSGVPLEIRPAGSADEALRQLNADERFHAVILDWNLPALTGTDFLMIIRNEYPRLPVLILTGAPATVDLPAALGLGAETVIAKPADLDHWERLAHVVHGFCEDVREVNKGQG